MTAEQGEQRAAFDDVRAALHETELRYGAVRPGKLLIATDRTTHSFTEASEAMDSYKMKIEPTLPPEEADKDEWTSS